MIMKTAPRQTSRVDNGVAATSDSVEAHTVTQVFSRSGAREKKTTTENAKENSHRQHHPIGGDPPNDRAPEKMRRLLNRSLDEFSSVSVWKDVWKEAERHANLLFFCKTSELIFYIIAHAIQILGTLLLRLKEI